MTLNPVDACPECGFVELVPLGMLGDLRWYRCRQCGADSNQDDLIEYEGV